MLPLNRRYVSPDFLFIRIIILNVSPDLPCLFSRVPVFDMVYCVSFFLDVEFSVLFLLVSSECHTLMLCNSFENVGDWQFEGEKNRSVHVQLFIIYI